MDWYENSSQFWDSSAYPDAFDTYAGPEGVAIVNVFKDGRTTPGWGKDFLNNYTRRAFRANPRVQAFQRDGNPFAIVMRSVQMICLDLDAHDGAANGLVSARDLELPITLAETSKSGKGRHLFYRTNVPWDQGYDKFRDIIGLLPGVDVRAVGCVYHYESQRWNGEPLTLVPGSVHGLIQEHQAARSHESFKYATVRNAGPDDEEAIIIHDQLITELNKPILPGKRNNSLFAIGSKMMNAGVEDWENHIRTRGAQIGLGSTEVDKIIGNIGTYQP